MGPLEAAAVAVVLKGQRDLDHLEPPDLSVEGGLGKNLLAHVDPGPVELCQRRCNGAQFCLRSEL